MNHNLAALGLLWGVLAAANAVKSAYCWALDLSHADADLALQGDLNSAVSMILGLASLAAWAFALPPRRSPLAEALAGVIEEQQEALEMVAKAEGDLKRSLRQEVAAAEVARKRADEAMRKLSSRLTDSTVSRETEESDEATID